MCQPNKLVTKCEDNVIIIQTCTQQCRNDCDQCALNKPLISVQCTCRKQCNFPSLVQAGYYQASSSSIINISVNYTRTFCSIACTGL